MKYKLSCLQINMISNNLDNYNKFNFIEQIQFHIKSISQLYHYIKDSFLIDKVSNKNYYNNNLN